MHNSPNRQFKAKVELYNGSTLAKTFNYTDSLKSFEIERVGENSKFFGFGISQKLTLKLQGVEDIATNNSRLKVYITNGEEYEDRYPSFFVNETKRDENTNELTVTAYDVLNKANSFTVNDIALKENYTVLEYLNAIATKIGATNCIGEYTAFSALFDNGANFNGTESLKSVLNAAAEFTGTIYFVNNADQIRFRRIASTSDAATANIGKNAYFTLTSKEPYHLTTLYLTTELGDNIHATNGGNSAEQYIKDNPFFDAWGNKATQIEALLAAYENKQIVPFNCEWRGNYLVTVGSNISIIDKDNISINTHLINDRVIYDGGFKQISSADFERNSGETASNPTTIGEALKNTYAKVDKVNKQIDLVASETTANTEAISSLQIDTKSISASVESVAKETKESLEEMAEGIKTISSKVDVAITAEDVKIEVTKQIADKGTNKVTTTSGTFNDNGLTIAKSGSQISTTISENGMTVNHNSQALLTANSEGVKAADLHATTFLIVGENSRFEDYGNSRTACFWIGG